jgi:crotonobetainyl-CoA:carnitine CoA-transferase CaiB-like acyl-CoA transferase
MARLPDPELKHERTTGGAAFYNVYETADGRHLVLGAQETKFVENLLGRLGRLDLAPLCARGPGAYQQPVTEFLRGVFAEKPLAHWHDFFAGLDVSYAPVNSLREALDDASVRALGLVKTDEAGREHIMPVARFKDEPAAPVLKEPALGEHNDPGERAGAANVSRPSKQSRGAQ